ncbi:MAG: NOB1 family endonuclease [Promethearchaeota archaeon]
MTVLKNNDIDKDDKILIFDANIFLTGIDFNILDEIIYTTPNIIKEIKINKTHRNIINKIQVAIDTKKLRLKAPKKKFIQKIEKKSIITGDINALSKEDKELLALTLEFLEESNQNVKLFTNDYSMENVCSKLKIPFSPLYKEGIKLIIIWEVYCPYCKIIYKPEDLNRNCEKCGLALKRRPKRINES